MKTIRRSEFDSTDEQVKVVNRLISELNTQSERVELLELEVKNMKKVKKVIKKNKERQNHA